MWFSPQKRLDKSVLGILLGISSFIHVFLIVLLVVVLPNQTFLQADLLRAKGARVSMGIGQKSSAGSSAPMAEAQPAIAQKVSVPEQKPQAVVAEKKQKVKPLEKQPDKHAVSKTALVQKKDASVGKQKEKEIKKTPKKEIPQKAEPVYSNLKQNFSSLPKKQEQKLQPQSLGSESVAAQSGVHTGDAGSKKGAPSAEKIEVIVEEAAISDNVYVREFGKWYAIPPGFEEHESFTISFVVENGKIVEVSPLGSEPLVLYTAAKDAVIRMQVPQSKYRKKLVFIIK